jgi:hypothetical protein
VSARGCPLTSAHSEFPQQTHLVRNKFWLRCAWQASSNAQFTKPHAGPQEIVIQGQDSPTGQFARTHSLVHSHVQRPPMSSARWPCGGEGQNRARSKLHEKQTWRLGRCLWWGLWGRSNRRHKELRRRDAPGGVHPVTMGRLLPRSSLRGDRRMRVHCRLLC